MLETNNEWFIGGSINDKILIIMRLIEDDRGKYFCIVINVVGFVLMDVILGWILFIISILLYFNLVIF